MDYIVVGMKPMVCEVCNEERGYTFRDRETNERICNHCFHKKQDDIQDRLDQMSVWCD